MSKQIIATVYIGNTPQSVAFNTDLIYIQEVTGNSVLHSTIYYFGDPLNPTRPTNNYVASEAVSDLVSASDNALVQATVWSANNSGKLTASLQYAFPTSGYAILTSTPDSDIQSIIQYRDNTFGVEETQSDLVDAANAGGGGGSQTWESTLSQQSSTPFSETHAVDIGSNLFILTATEASLFAVGIIPETSDPFASIGSYLSNDNYVLVAPLDDSISLKADHIGLLKAPPIYNPEAENVDVLIRNQATGEIEITPLTSTLLPIEGTGTATGNITGNLNENTLVIQNGILDIAAIIQVDSATTFTGTLADAITGNKNVVNGIIMD